MTQNFFFNFKIKDLLGCLDSLTSALLCCIRDPSTAVLQKSEDLQMPPLVALESFEPLLALMEKSCEALKYIASSLSLSSPSL